jgi:anti-anti-sigma factor
MTHDELSIDLKTENGGATLAFTLRGSLDLATAPTVRAALSEATETSSHDLIIDLTQLEFLDSTGLGVLIGAHRRAAERGGSFRLIVRSRACSTSRASSASSPCIIRLKTRAKIKAASALRFRI